MILWQYFLEFLSRRCHERIILRPPFPHARFHSSGAMRNRLRVDKGEKKLVITITAFRPIQYPPGGIAGTVYTIPVDFPFVAVMLSRMARLSRIVIPGMPHHVTQRGNRRFPTFFEDGDYDAYLTFLAEGCAKAGTEVWAYCLMPNHVHLLLVPKYEDGLRATLGETHRKYTRMINFREQWRGHLWQERFASFPTDATYTLNVARYIELNPVRAKLCGKPVDYPWSSAKAHILGCEDPLLNTSALLQQSPEWESFLLSGRDQRTTDLIKLHENTGRPLGNTTFIARIEAMLGRFVAPQKLGRKSKEI